LGTTGDYAVFSTHERKLITTGEGGFILVKKQGDYEKLLEIRSFGEVAQSGVEFNNIKGAYGYCFGLNFKLSAVNAAIGISQVAKLEEKLKVRAENARYLVTRMKGLDMDIGELRTREGSISNYYSAAFITNAALRNKIEQALLSKEVISDPLRYRYCPLYEMPLLKKYALPCPQAEILVQSVFTLPVHEGLAKNDLDYFISIIQALKNG
jgi:dTDP-4-amino-4,6-dideoxygalactose transaminase